MNTTLRRYAAIICGLCLMGTGCSVEEGEPKHPVTGTVVWKGKPVEGAIVAFTPATGGAPASAVTDATGVFRLTTKVSGDGAVAGEYSVTVAKYQSTVDEPTPAPSADAKADPFDITNEYPTGYDEMEESELAAAISKNLLPPKYAQATTSGLTATVVEGDNQINLELK